MKKKIISISIASIIATGSGQVMANQFDEEDSSNQPYAEMSIGAVGGALLAGPAGFVIGGIVGSLIGGHETGDEVQEVDNLAVMESMVDEVQVSTDTNDEPKGVLLASSNNSIPNIGDEKSAVTNTLKEIISNDLSMGVYFKAGSVDIEKFYTQQLSVISNLLTEIPDLQLNLDGYSDRQGDESENLQLSIARLQSVRNYFVSQGVDENRIKVNAYGEKNFNSSPGELSAYVFDRRVVVSFTATPSGAGNVAVISNASSL